MSELSPANSQPLSGFQRVPLAYFMHAISRGKPVRRRLRETLLGPNKHRTTALAAFSDGDRTFVICNQMLAMSQYDPQSGDYSDYVFETVCVVGSAQEFEALEPGSTSCVSVRWSKGVYGPSGGITAPAFNTLDESGGEAPAIRDAAVECFQFEGRLCEWLRLLEITYGGRIWRLSPYTTPDFLLVDDGPLT